MKAKSFTKKRLNNKEKKLVNLATSYLIDWTKKELGKYINEPVVIPYGDHGFLIGKFQVKGIAKNCWAVERLDGKVIHNFISKANAVLYCLCEVSNNYNSARELLVLDDKIGRLENDMLQYQRILLNSKDTFKTQLIYNRYIDARYQHRANTDILKKTLKLAKYSKFGNQTL